jgi:delta24-sterol reductase
LTDEQHKRRVMELAEQVKVFYGRREPFRVYHGSTNSTRVVSFERDKMVDVSGMDRVLNVDEQARVAVVEANVPMDKLVAATLRHGLVPPVVMEFPGITVGGGLQGGAGESSSHRWGTFNRTLEWFEVVLGNGEVVRASRSENADLFWGSAGSYGSLGVVTAAAVKLIPARRYVELKYEVVLSFEEARAAMQRQVAQGPEYVDGIMFARDLGVVVTGTLTDVARGPVRRFSRARDEWFYLHAEAVAREGAAVTETVPLVDYLFRYDRGAFWTGKYAFERVGMAFNKLTRRLLDPLMHTRKMYEALQASGASQEFMIQDLALPEDRVVEFMEYVDRELGIYPLWLCPLMPDADSPLLSSALPARAIVNVGVWGYVGRDYDQVVKTNRELERELAALGGRKWLYAYGYYSEAEFWRTYDKDWYMKLRGKYYAQYLPTVFDKTCRHSRSTVNLKRGVWRTMLGFKGIRLKG